MYNMLKRLLEQQQVVSAVFLESEKCDVRLLMPSSEEFTVAQEVNEILKTFHSATEIISAEKYPTIGIVHLSSTNCSQWHSKKQMEILHWLSQSRPQFQQILKKGIKD